MKTIYAYTDEEQEHDGAYCYVFGANGCYLRKSNLLCRATIKVDPHHEFNLRTVKEELELNDNIRIPWRWVYRAVAFFRAVQQRYKTEAFLLILMEPESGTISLACPRQIVPLSGAHTSTAT